MPLGDVCLHVGVPVLTTTDPDEETWIEGEPDEETQPGVAFDCFYMDPGAREQPSPRGKRKIDGPTLLFEGERDDGSLIHLLAEDQIVIDAEEILGTGAVTLQLEGEDVDVPGFLFQVDGDPTPLAAPGDLIGWEARLKRVID